MTDQLRLFDDQPVTASALSVSGTITHVTHKPRRPLGVLTKGVAIVEYEVTQAVHSAASKLGVGLVRREQVAVRRFFPLADQAAAREAIEALERQEREAPDSPADPELDDDRHLQVAR